MARTKGAKNKPKDFPVKLSELDTVKNELARKEDQLIEFFDDLTNLNKQIAQFEEDVALLESKIESYREILKTLLEITE
jgi:septal ring factor EnvC (AmiA/AmiB activator)